MLFDIRLADLGRVNSMTKYPSIPTYHVLGEKGRLTEEVGVGFGQDTVWVEEKIDGTNARIVVCPDQTVLIGSREEFIHCLGDLVPNPCLGIVEGVKDTALRVLNVVRERVLQRSSFCVLFGEFYGKGIGPGGNYTRVPNHGFRLFDVAYVPDWEQVLGMPRESIASWRDNGGQCWADREDVSFQARVADVPTVPIRAVIGSGELPKTLEEGMRFLQQWPFTSAGLDDGSPSLNAGRPEGVIVRNRDRSKIAKLRVEDYAKALRGGR